MAPVGALLCWCLSVAPLGRFQGAKHLPPCQMVHQLPSLRLLHLLMRLKEMWPVQNYYVYLALKQNTNIYNLQAAAKLGLDVTDDSYTSAPGDCQYANSTVTANGGRRLLHGGDMDMDASSPSG